MARIAAPRSLAGNFDKASADSLYFWRAASSFFCSAAIAAGSLSITMLRAARETMCTDSDMSLTSLVFALLTVTISSMRPWIEAMLSMPMKASEAISASTIAKPRPRR